MRRLYYLTDDLATLCQLVQALEREGISRWRLHVLSAVQTQLDQHDLQGASRLQRFDIIHCAERFALLGALAGLVLGLLASALLATPVDPWSLLSMTGLGLLLGALGGALLGCNRDNVLIQPFRTQIDAGKHLLMVDVAKAEKCRVRELVNLHFRQVQAVGVSKVVAGPFQPRIELRRS